MNDSKSSLLLQKSGQLLTRGQYREALSLFKDAETHLFDDPRLLFNYAFCLDALRAPAQAINLLIMHIKQITAFAKCCDLLARLLEKIGRHQDALTIIDEWLEKVGNNEELLRSKIFILRMMQNANLACDISENLDLSLTQNQFIHAICLHESGECDSAISLLEQIVKREPLLINAHDFLNKLYWESNNTGLFLKSYSDQLALTPESLALWHAMISMQILAEAYDDALANTELALKHHSADITLKHMQSVVLSRLEQHSKAQARLDECLAVDPSNTRYLIDKAVYNLETGQNSTAMNLLQSAIAVQAFNQETMAYIASTLRTISDEQRQWLYNYDAFIHTVNIQSTFNEHCNNANAWTDLQTLCKALHQKGYAPLDQSVRGGTQTSGKVLSIEHPLIEALLDVLRSQIDKYLTTLPSDPNHPFLSRFSDNYYFAGSWSVKLQNAGLHISHVHPQGWLSICLYIALPEAVKQSQADKQGWIYFGKSHLNINETPDLEIQPEEGKLIIFPAYFWHGTYKFDASPSEHRLSLIADIEPTYKL